MKSIILCADDYGLCEPVGAGIRELVVRRCLSAVSCMSSAPAWPEEAALLKPLRDQIDVGLHFNLTLGFAAPAPGLTTWLKNSLTGQSDLVAVEKAFLQQLDLFESVWGSPPDFIDGHQHVHVFPGIRHRLLQLISKRYPVGMRPWIRLVTPPLTGHDAPLKALIVRMLSLGFARNARQAGLDLPRGFAGLYSLSGTADFPAMMAGWLRHSAPGTVVMCHPSLCAEHDPDGIGQARLQEFQYLRSSAFDDTCTRLGITLARFGGPDRYKEKGG